MTVMNGEDPADPSVHEQLPMTPGNLEVINTPNDLENVITDIMVRTYAEGLAAGLSGCTKDDCWYVDELRAQWMAGFERGRRLAVMAAENKMLSDQNKELAERLERGKR